MKCRIPPAAGIGLRAPHVEHVLETLPPTAWFEVHSENYFAEGGYAARTIEAIRDRYALSLHGVGLALGSAEPLDRAHLAKLRHLVDRLRPGLVSEHLAWGRVPGRHLNDLLPMPFTEEALEHVAQRVVAVQDVLGRRILVENVSSYYRFPESTIPEAEFLVALAERASCRLLLDVNNVFVNAANHGLDAAAYIDAIPAGLVAEIHLAGFEARGELLVDTHGRPVDGAVWSLFERAIARFGPQPTLIEWDTDIPAFEVLEREAARAQAVLGRRHVLAA